MCEESFTDLQKLRVHLLESHSKCEFCGKTFGRGGPKAPEILRRHIQQVHKGQKNYCCSICGKPFYGFTDMKRHEKRHDDPNYPKKRGKPARIGTTCELCGKVSVKNLSRHIRQVHEGEAENVCETCGKSFFGKGDMKRHIDSVHLKKPNVWKRKSNPKNLAMDQS